MAYINASLRSTLMGRSVAVSLYFPNDYPETVVPEIRGVITLLHGYTNSGQDWLQMSAACRYAADNGLILVAPSCENSFYCDMAYGDAWYTFVTEELPVLLNRFFKLPTEREKNFIAGLSMGGYGAMMIGLNQPQRYAGIASFSGSVDLAQMFEKGRDLPELRRLFVPVFGQDLTLPDQYDLYKLAVKVSSLPQLQQPKLLLTCGLQDDEPYYICMQNNALHETMQALPFAAYRYLTWPGNHEWKFWDRSLVYAIDYFLDNGYAEQKLGDWRSEVQIAP